MNKIVVTGGAGFLGINLVKSVIKKIPVINMYF